MSAEATFQTLGRYRIVRELGRGAYGVVYLAHDTVLQVQRALKVLHPILTQDESLRQRFLREAQLAARLEHPHIVPVYDFGQEQGRTFLTMRYMAQGSLKERLKKNGPLSWEEALRITRQIAEGLAYTHAQGVIHRDLKPANILFDAQGQAAIGDFGFAKAISSAGDTLSLTLSSPLIGTLPYMAPEIWHNKNVGPPADQYALACIVFEMLTGQILFAGATSPEVMMKHVLEAPPLPTTWPQPVPEGLTEVLLKALAKNPEDRFENVFAFIQALQALQARPKPPAWHLPSPPLHPQHKEPGTDHHGFDPPPPLPIRKSDIKYQYPPPTSSHPIQHEKRSPREVSHTAVDFHKITPFNAKLLRQLTKIVVQTVTDMAWGPHNRFLAVATSEGIFFIDPTTQHEKGFWKSSTWINSIDFSPDGTMLAIATNEPVVQLMRVANGEIIQILKGHGGKVLSVRFAPRWSLLASGSADTTIRLWQVPDGNPLRVLRGHTASVNTVAFAPRATLLASGGGWNDHSVRLWKLPEGRLQHTLRGHQGWVRSVAFSPRSDLLASGGGGWAEQTIRLWRVDKGKVLRVLITQGWVRVVTFSPDGTILAAGTRDDNTIYLWQVSNGQHLISLRGHTQTVSSLCFSPDGRWLCSGSWDGTVRIWGIPKIIK